MGKNGVVVINKLIKDQKFIVSDGENKTFVILLLDGLEQLGDVKIAIKGKSANVAILGIIVGYGKQKINLYTLQDHFQPNSVSDLFIKSVLFDESKFNYRGLIKIEKNAQKSNAYQKNQNLLMSPSAWADSRPYLEILANDVRCTHGATIGRVDEQQLYYLATRGLSEIEATKLIVSGFYQEILDRIPNREIQIKLKKRLDSKINNLLTKYRNLI